jgi:tRNA 2-thiouridine synthesizing protein A
MPSYRPHRAKHGERAWLAQARRLAPPCAMSETILDVKGLNCPLPVLRANRVLRGMEPGARLRVLATDRATVADFQAFCHETGHALLAWSEENGVFNFLIRRRPADPAVTED